MLSINQERSLLELFRDAKSEEEYSHRIASFGSMIIDMNNSVLKKLVQNSSKGEKSITLLGRFLEEKGLDGKKIIKTLRNINSIRQGYPIHSDTVNKLIESYSEFEIDYPVQNYSEAWIKIRKNYIKALDELLVLLN